LNANANFYNLTLGAAMFLVGSAWPSRCWQSLAASPRKKTVSGLARHPCRTSGLTFACVLFGIIMIVAALTFLSRTVPGTDCRTRADAGRTRFLGEIYEHKRLKSNTRNWFRQAVMDRSRN